ncbi:MAG TPA: cytochrome b [Steroidobacteraceae bacterium]|nr:cytochrome b [Steroidobacteraceae bacterium]
MQPRLQHVTVEVQVHPSLPRVDIESGYTRTAIALHWLIALCVFGQILLGWYVDEIPRGTAARSWYVNLHKSIGITLALAIIFRLFWRIRYPPPPLPSSLAAWQRIAASLSHHLLYACMLIMPLTGYIASNFSEYGVRYFNAYLLPPWGVEDERIYGFFNGVHVLTSYVFVTLIVVHIVGALRHAALRDGIFRRIWPGRR